MRRAKLTATILAAIILVVGSIHARLPAKIALRRMKVAEGLAVTLFAAEPDLVNPTSMDIDAQGRVWVTEAANYRLFKNPLTRKGGDRIRILEDTDGDGRCDVCVRSALEKIGSPRVRYSEPWGSEYLTPGLPSKNLFRIICL